MSWNHCVLLILLVIWIQDGQLVRQEFHHSQARHHSSHNHKNVAQGESDTFINISDQFNTIESNSLEIKTGKYQFVEGNTSNEKIAIFPAIFDVAPLSHIEANATCGGSGSSNTDETYCKLTKSQQCSVCSKQSIDKCHEINYTIDHDSSNWWQSPTLEQGAHYEYVTIIMDLKQEYYVWNVIIKCAISPRPANWILERSIDGSRYSVWQYFASTEEECWQRYNKPAISNTSYIPSDNETLCTTHYSQLRPLENGQIHAYIAKGRPGCVSSCTLINSNKLKDFCRARFLRFRFQKFNIPKDKSSTLSDLSLRRSLFYSIKKISVSAQCICHGHASKCKPSHNSNDPVCECRHDTCGNNCERCCPLFNQFAWKEASLSEANICEQCQCHGHADACVYDYTVASNNASLNIYGQYQGGGRCINCKKHTTGINCEKCESEYYRPRGVPPNANDPCLPCECYEIGTNGSCVPDDAQYLVDGKKPGSCICLEGFAGDKCDRCAPGFSSFPSCEKCQCDPRGTEQSESCEKNCVCKRNVEGEFCDQCKIGYLHLSSSNPLGCNQCYCSNIAHTCTETTSLKLNHITSTGNWSIIDPTLSIMIHADWDNESNVSVIYDSDIESGISNYYWLAPPEFLGNKLTSFGLVLRVSVSWNVQRGDTSGKPVYNPDIIIVGSNGLRIAHGNRNYEGSYKMMLSVRLSEHDWYKLDENTFSSEYSHSPIDCSRKATRADMLSVLTHIKYFLIRAKFHSDQADCSLIEVNLETGLNEDDESKPSVSGIEKCYCPTGYAGLSCETCDYGYVRLSSNSDQLICTSCDCNNHSPSCDPVTGRCEKCEHNTTGVKCEACLDGYYGLAESGTRGDCNPCACPRIEASNNFSPTCFIRDSTTKQYICNDCPTGYTGNHCEKCAEGYFGDPMRLGSVCTQCNCNGKPCNSTTGQCLDCESNTEGWFCERCKIGYFRNGVEKICSKCDCDPIGSENTTICHMLTGQCSCKMNYVGRTCDRCLDGFGDINSGCTPCNCNFLGSKSEMCDPMSGQCECKVGVEGKTCNRCMENRFGFDSGYGCEICNCSKVGSEGDDCDSLTGQCPCKKNVIARNCDQCVAEYWGLDNNGCKACDCDETGSMSPFCDVTTGQCSCKYGVIGLRCDQCKENFYGFSTFGCFECEPCTKSGHVCDILSGRCICSDLTEGNHCEHCISGAWNYTSPNGCQDCSCDKQGSMGNHCNFITGQCECRTGFGSTKCNTCATGYFGFPKCRPCSCNLAGTDPGKCAGDTCLCDGIGQCPCKLNAEGKKCDRCKEGTFGLSSENPIGCTTCFCFGRSTQCTEAGLIWSHNRLLSDRILLVHYNISSNSSSNSADIYPVNPQQICYINYMYPDQNSNFSTGSSGSSIKLNVTNNLRLIPGINGDVEIGVDYLFEAPIYWQLPDSFLGDKILSYGGFIEFLTETEGESTLLPTAILASYPLIQIQGNDKFILEYFPPISTSDKRHRVRIHESLWRSKDNPTDSVSREIFMLTLQNVQYILIRASESIDFTKAMLKDVSLDVAVKGLDITHQISSVTDGIELCECPNQYSSSSCQNPSIGYYRYYDSNTTAVSTIIIQMIGEAAPCECNGLSNECDSNTAECLNCTGNTGGRHCERCAEGYFRDEMTKECMPCPCPHVENNHGLACYLPSSLRNISEQVTCHCQLGYTGKLCDRCNYEYYGYPRQRNGRCKPCNCNPWGMTSNECHEETGQCNCKTETTGRDCSLCIKKYHVLTSKGCVACQYSCYQMLFDEMEEISTNFTIHLDFFLPKIFEPPWNFLRKLNDSCEVTQRMFNSSTTAMQQILDYASIKEEDLRKKLKNSKVKIKSIMRYIQNLNSSAASLSSDVTMLYNISDVINHQVNVIRDSLQSYIQSENWNFNLFDVLSEARFLLNDINQWSLGIYEEEEIERILSSCRISSQNVKNHQSHGFALDLLKKKIRSLEERMTDFNSIIEKANELIRQATVYTKISRDILEWVKNISQDIDNTSPEIEDKLSESKILTEQTQKGLNATMDHLQNMFYNLQKVRTLIKLVENKERMLYNSNKDYRIEYVKPAIYHANELMNKARYYEGLFVPTRQDADNALRASKAYKNIADAIEDALEIIQNCNELIGKQFSRNKTSIIENSNIIGETSRQLLNRGQLGKTEVEYLKKQYDYQQKEADDLQLKLQEIKRNVSIIIYQLQEMNKANDKIKSMQNSLKKYKTTIEIPDKVYDDIFSVQDKTNQDLRPKVIQIQGLGDIGLHPGDELKIREAEEVTWKMLSQLQITRHFYTDRIRYFDKWNSSLSDELLALKNKIKQTKHLANGIQLSLSSKNDQELCSRNYRTKYIKPDIINYISLTYAIHSQHRDSLLFYLGSSVNDDFLAVEMFNRKIRFVWDLGGGPAEVTHPLHIQTAVDLEKNQYWYKIDVERIGNIGKLSVRPVSGSAGSVLSNTFTVTNNSVAGWSKLDVSSNDQLWIGGIDKPVSSYILSKQSGLFGCLSGVTFDNRPIGLWNFKYETPGNCIARSESTEEVREEGPYFFTGDGYAALQSHSSSVYNKYYFSVGLNFKSFDENSVLFYAAAAKPYQYILVMIKDSRVVFQIRYTPEIMLEIRSSSRYVMGNFTRVEATRFYDRKKKVEKGVLKMGGESKEGFPTPALSSQSETPDLSAPRYFFGGVPSDFEPAASLPQSFLGCMTDLQVMQESYNPFKGPYWGVERTCSDKPATVVSFKGNGYLELVSYSLKKMASFSFIFSTTQKDVFLMLSTTEGLGSSEVDETMSDEEEIENQKAHYYSASLKEGRVEVTINSGIGDTRLISRSDSFYSDGQSHSLNVIKTGKRFELRVDDIIQAIGFMEVDGSSDVKAAGKVGGLFFGGLPADLVLNSSTISSVPYVGTISNAIFNNKLLHFDEPIEFERANIGRPSTNYLTSVPREPPSSMQNTQEASSCHKSHFYSAEPFAVQFGDLPRSYVRLEYDRHVFHTKNCTIQLMFRTFYTDGLLVFIPAADNNQNQWVKLLLHSGKVYFIVKSKKTFEMSRGAVYNDGNWHKIQVTRDGRTLSMTVDDLPAQQMQIPKKLNLLNVVYVGGYLSDFSSLDTSFLKVDTLKGCIKDVIINNKRADLTGEKAKHNHIGQCFSRIEKGAFFSGDGYSVIAERYNLSNTFYLEFDFRTNELNGVLLSISGPERYPYFSLELVQGKVVVNGDLGDRRPLKIEQEFSLNHYLCDNQWHHLKISLADGKITLHVDNKKKVYWLLDNGHMTGTSINNPLFLGGIPDNAIVGDIRSGQNFKGCIRNVVLGNLNVDWINFAKMHNVLISSCPVQ